MVVAEGGWKKDAGAVKKYIREKRGARNGVLVKNIMTILRFINKQLPLVSVIQISIFRDIKKPMHKPDEAMHNSDC